MKQKILLIKHDYFKKVLRYFLLEIILLLIYLSLNFESKDTIILTLGLNKITFYDQIRDIIRLIDTGVLTYSVLFIYFYDLKRNPEFILLREKNQKYIIDKLMLVLILNIIIKSICFLFINFTFGQMSILDKNLINDGLINIMFTIFTITSLLNLYSQNKYLSCFVVIGTFVYNLFFDINCFWIVTLLLVFLSFALYSSQKIYNKYIR